MQCPTEATLNYYDSNADNFVATTANVEFSSLQEDFISRLPQGACVLDLGCGSGRDSLAFLKAGFRVVAMDGSVEMARAANKLTGLPVTQALFQSYQPEGVFDGIWACSSLLHVPAKELPKLIGRYSKHLNAGGTFYLSFKLGNFEGMRNGRWFTDLTENTFRSIVDQIEGLEIDRINITSDVRPGREDEQWLNAWCVKATN